MDIVAHIYFKKGGQQSLGFLGSLRKANVVYRNPPQITGGPIPLSGFSYSLSLGTSPSSGTCKVSGLFVTTEMLKSSDFEDVAISVEAGGPEIPGDKFVYFDRMKIVDFTFAPLVAPEGGDRVYTVNFQDIRWRLGTGAIWGYFNRTIKIKKREIYLANTLKDGKTPWTYKDLIGKCAEASGVSIEVSISKQDFAPGPKVSFSEDALARLDEYPLNKEYSGKKPSAVLAELLNEIGFTLTCSPGGVLYACPLAGNVELGNADQEPTGSSAGAKYKSVPDNVYLIGGRVHDQIKIMPDLGAFKKFITDRLRGATTSAEHHTLTGYKTRMAIEGEDAIKKSKEFGLEPVCPDITGRLRNFYELIGKWGVSIETASMPYQHGYGESVWRDLFARGLTYQTSILEHELSKLNEQLKYWEKEAIADPLDTQKRASADEYLEKVREKKAEIREAQEKVDEKREGIASQDIYLYPEEQALRDKRPDFDVLASKTRIAQQYFFKLYRIPEWVKVTYDWSGETEKEIKEKYVPDAPEGIDLEVPRSYVLPYIPYLEEDIVHEIEDEEEEEKAEDKGKSGSEQKKEEKGGQIDFRKVQQPTQIRIRLWSYQFARIASGVHEFLFQNIKERTLECADFDPELGLVLIHKAPYLINNYSGFSEDCPFIEFGGPVGAEISYERKDPELGPLNFYLHKLEKPKSVLSSPPDRKDKIDHFEQINEFVDYLKEGEKQEHSAELDEIAGSYAGEIWEKVVGTDASRVRSSVAAPIYAFPFGPLQSVSWRSAPFTTQFEVNTDYQSRVGITLTERIRKSLGTGVARHGRTFDVTQEFEQRLGYWAVRQNDRFQDDERRIVINVPHFGAICMYDPKQEEDVIAVSATLFDPKTHYHTKWWLGPLLCHETEGGGNYRMAILATGHFWWTPNDDLCLIGGHEHKIGGYYYPYVYVQPEGLPPLAKNYIKGEKGFFPKSVRLVNEGATDSFFKAEEFTDRGVDSGLGDAEILSGKIKEVPEVIYTADPTKPKRTKMSLGLLVEYCIDSTLVAPSSGQFHVDFQLVTKGDSFDSGATSPPRTESGTYTLPLSASEAFTKQRQLLTFLDPSVGEVNDFDNVSIELARSHSAVLSGDDYRDSIYILEAELVWGWLETAPVPSSALPVF